MKATARRRSIGVLFVIIAAALTGYSQDSASLNSGHRKALLIGNGEYSALRHLPFISKGLQHVAESLGKTGFEVTSLDNITANNLSAQIKHFIDELESGDVFLFYYSGYAVQASVDGQSGNYLLPTDFDPVPVRSKKAVFDDFAYPIKELYKASHQKLRLMIIIVDAPWIVDLNLTEILGDGLMFPALPEDGENVVAFAATPDVAVEVPSDGGESLFSGAFANGILQPLELMKLLSDIQGKVKDASNQQQQPVYFPNVRQTFYFTLPKNPDPQLGRSYQNPKDHEYYVWIPSGTFNMGCVPGSKCESQEKPQHPVTLTKSFWMGTTEVTVLAYERYVAVDKKNRRMPQAPLWNRKFQKEDLPIASVSWEGARDYCQWAGGRLPTEAEWEYAARDNVPDQIYPFNDENSRDHANFAGKKEADIWEDTTSPVRSFSPSPRFSLYDMAGNVWEWVNDWYSATYYGESPPIDPLGPATGKGHVARGGSYDSDPKEHLRISFRKPFKTAENNVGFRCVLDDTPQTRKRLGVQ